MMQASLVIVGGVLGLVAYFSSVDWRGVLGALVLLAYRPYTIFVIMPTNRHLNKRSALGRCNSRLALDVAHRTRRHDQPISGRCLAGLEQTHHRRGTGSSNPVPSGSESANSRSQQ
jgi:hypothetical protein